MRQLLYSAAALAAVAATFAASNNAASTFKPVSSDKAWNFIQAGNKRFVEATASHPNQDEVRRETVAKGQRPHTIVLACADSRVSPELVFDQGLGDLFVLRVAGNTVNDEILGSMEYAVDHLHSKLIVVMGHERCGAVDAAIKGGHLHGNLEAIVEPIESAVHATAHMPGDRTKNTVCENVRHTIKRIKRESKLIGGLYGKGHVKIVGAYYDLDDGKILKVQ